MADQETRYTIKINAKEAKQALRGLAREASQTGKSVSEMGKGANFSGLGSSMKRLADGIQNVAQQALQAAQAFLSMAREGQQLQQLAGAFAGLGGNNDKIAELRELTRGMVDDATLQKMYNMSQLFGLSGEKVAQFAEIAVGASIATGQSVDKMFEDIMTAASRGSRLIADNLGILVNVGAANEKYAAKLGKSVSQLTDAEKSLAFQEALVEGATRQRALAQGMANNEIALGDTAVKNFVNEMKVFAAEIFVGMGAMEGFGGGLDYLRRLFEENRDLIQRVAKNGFTLLTSAVGRALHIFEKLLPLLDAAAALAAALTPLLEGAAFVFGKLVQIVGVFVQNALGGLFTALDKVLGMMEAVADTLGLDGLAGSLERARDVMQDYRDGLDEAVEIMGQKVEVTEQATQAQETLTVATEASTQALRLFNMEQKATTAGAQASADFIDGLATSMIQLDQTSEDRARRLISNAEEAEQRLLSIEAVFATQGGRNRDIAKSIIDQQGVEGLKRFLDEAEATIARAGEVGVAAPIFSDVRIAEMREVYAQALRETETQTTRTTRAVTESAEETESAFSRVAAAIANTYAQLQGVAATHQMFFDQFVGVAEGLGSIFEGALGTVQTFGAQLRQEVSELGQEFEAQMEAQKQAAIRFGADTVTALGDSIQSALVNAITGAQSLREQTFAIMGDLFGKLSTAFIAWATAEGNLLKGNPIAAAAAAVALGTVAKLIGAFGQRKGGGGASGSSANTARRQQERPRKEERQPTIMIINNGLAVNDRQAKGIAQAYERGQRLRNRRAA